MLFQCQYKGSIVDLFFLFLNPTIKKLSYLVFFNQFDILMQLLIMLEKGKQTRPTHFK